MNSGQTATELTSDPPGPATPEWAITGGQVYLLRCRAVARAGGAG